MPDDPDNSPARILTFHKIADGFPFESTHFHHDRLVKLFTKLIDSGERLSNRLDFNSSDIVITFDDGYAHLSDLLPKLIERFRFKPILFIPTNLIGESNAWEYSHSFKPTRHLNAEQIQELAKAGVIFGSHSHSHIDLTAVDQNRLEAELSVSKSILEDLTGQPIDQISYPFGRLNETVREAANTAGYKTGFSMAFPELNDDHMAVGRYAVYCYDTTGSIKRKLNRGPCFGIEKFKASLTNRLAGGTILLNRLKHRNQTETS